jgi:hypothetical protein
MRPAPYDLCQFNLALIQSMQVVLQVQMQVGCNHCPPSPPLVCRDLQVLGGAVFWPVKAQQPEAGWIQASDHRPVYLDVEMCAAEPQLSV